MREKTEDLISRGKESFDELNYEKAEKLFLEAAHILQPENNDQTKLAEVFSYLGKINFAFGEFGAALDHYDHAIEASRNSSDFRGEAKYLMEMGTLLAGIGELESALEKFQSSLSFSSAFEDQKSVAALNLQIAEVLRRQEQYEDAIQNYESALNYYSWTGEKKSAVLALIGLGKIAQLQRNYDKARENYKQAQSLIDPSEDPITEASLRLNYGLFLRSQGEWNTALRELRDGTNRLRAKRIGKEYETLLLFYLGRIYDETGRLEEAKKFYSDALTIARKNNDRLSEVYLSMFLLKVEENSVAGKSQTSDLENLVGQYNEISDRFGALEHRTGLALAKFESGKHLLRMGKIEEGLRAFEHGFDVLESKYGEFIVPGIHDSFQSEWKSRELIDDAYALAAKTALELNKFDEAFRYLERNRARDYHKFLSNANVEVRTEPVRKLVNNVRSMIGELHSLRLELTGILVSRFGVRKQAHVDSLTTLISIRSRDLSELRNTISKSYPNHEYLVEGSSIGISEIQSFLPSGTVLIQFLPMQNEMIIFALSKKTHLVRFVPVTRDQLTSMMQEYLSLLKDPNVYAGAGGEASLRPMTRFAILSTQLYDTFFRPIDGFFERNLIILCDKMFESFPFHALERQEVQGTVRYLVEITGTSYLPSSNSIRYSTVSASRVQSVVGLGNPNGKNWSIDYELRDIRSFIRDTKILIAVEATWENLRASHGDVLQLTTDYKHMSRVTPFGTMSFANPANIEDEIELPFDRLTLLPPYPITVLSNQYEAARGLRPLHALLLRNHGSAHVIFNAWHSDRKGSKFFSEFFYTHLGNGLPPVEAFRQALLNLIHTRDVNHPYQWAQFFHVGL